MTREVEYLTVADLFELSVLLLGDPPPIRDAGLLDAAAARPRSSAFGEDAYPDLWTKAAALLESIVGNHPLVDGNKRLGWLATAVFLDLNGVASDSATNADVYELVMRVAAESPTLDEIGQRLRSMMGD